MKRRSNSSWKTRKITDAETGAELTRQFAIALYDRKPGRAANWPLVAETLFRAAFAALDEMPHEAQPADLLRQVEDDAYNRLVGNSLEPPAPSVIPEPEPQVEKSPISLKEAFTP